MAAELKVGGRVRVVVTLMSASKPGETGKIVLATRLADGKVMYHVHMDPPNSAGLVSFYPHEIEPCDDAPGGELA